jgi:cytoskeletal protein RodZ
MSKTGKIILWIIIAVIVIGGIWWWIASQNTVSAPTTAINTTTGTSNASTSASSTYPAGNSNQAITQDLASVDAQLSGLNSDNASVTQSMNDQPVQQAQ